VRGERVADEIDAIMDPLYVSAAGLSNLRKLSADQRSELERVKWAVLCCVKPTACVTETEVRAALANTNDQAMLACDQIYRGLIRDYTEATTQAPGARERRHLRVMAWATFNSN